MRNILDFLNQVQSGGMPQNNAPQDDLAQKILSSRFTEPSFHDVANSTFEGALANKYVDPQAYAASNLTSSLDALNKLSTYQENVAKANLYNSGGSGSQTMKLAQGLMAENPGLTLADAVALVKSTGTVPLTVRNGKIVNLPGSVPAAGNIAGAKTTAEKQADITTEGQKVLPQVLDNAQTNIDLVDQALNHKGTPSNFGMSGIIPNRPGSEASDAAAILAQIRGGSFLAAYNQLRGGGQISNIEGAKAEDAYFRMQTSQSFEAFKKAAQDYKNIIQKAVNLARNTASGQIFQPENYQPSQPVTLNGAVGERTILKVFHSPSTGKIKTVYSDGTEEITDGQ